MMYNEKSSIIFRKYAIPQMIGLVINSAYFIVDGVFIGNRLGTQAMAAAAISVPFLEFLISIALMVSVGTGVLVSYKLGKKQFRQARELFNKSLGLLFIFSLTIVIFGNLFMDQLANILGSTPIIHNQAINYLWYIVTFSPFLLLSFCLSSFARSDNRPKLAMYSLIAGSLTNILLDYVFMYPLNMGIEGAALATAIGPILSVLILLPHFLKKKGELYFEKVKNLIDVKVYTKILSFGLSTFILEFSIGIVTFIYNYFIIKYNFNEVGLASYLMIGYLSMLILTAYLGIAQGIQPVISYLDGQDNHKKINELRRYFIKKVILIGLVFYIFVYFGSHYFYMIFNASDIQLIEFSTGVSKVYFIGFIVAGVNILITTFLQSLKQTKKALFISLLRSILLLPLLMIILPLLINNNGIWIAISLVEIITFIYVVYQLKELKFTKKQII